MELTVQNVYGLLLRSRLLPIEEARTMFARWNQEAKDTATQVAPFARWMVANKYLTDYQATLLARGHADVFFLGPYKILDRLGKGRMAGVYKAQHETGPVVAIKVLPPSKAKDPSLFGRFQREARLAVKLKHPNVVRTFQTGEGEQPGSADKLQYLVMEYIEGETLEDVLQRRKQFLPGEAVRLVYQALLGLQHLHEQGLVHRDIKPANLMLAYPATAPRNLESTLGATVKILDMGLARTLSDEGTAERPSDPTLTSEGIVLGTPDYMAPEQARDARSADIRADIYSLGCVLYHLLAGTPPFPDTNIISQMIRHATEAPRPLRDSNPAVPDGLQQIINWMLAKDPAQRYPTPARAAQALQVFLAAGSPAVAPESDPKMSRYLTWLETDSKAREKASPRPSSGSIPVAAAAKPSSGQVPTAKVAPAAKSDEAPVKQRKLHGKKKSKKARRSAASIQLPVAKVKNEAPAEVDVELVPLPAPAAAGSAEQRLFSLPLSRRDFFMFGVGVGTVAVGTGLGLLGAWLAGAFKKEPPDDPP